MGPNGCLAALHDTSYFVPGTRLSVQKEGSGSTSRRNKGPSALVGDLPALEQSFVIHRGDTIILTSDLTFTDSSTIGLGPLKPGHAAVAGLQWVDAYRWLSEDSKVNSRWSRLRAACSTRVGI